MWDKMVQNDVMCRDALYVEGAGRLPMPQGGSRGPPPGIFLQK